MKSIFTSIALFLFSMPLLTAQNNVTVDANAPWIAFMNVFFLDGNYDFGNAWGIPDVKTVLDTDANTIILQPNFNTYADNPNDPNWVNQTTGEGNKVMEASSFIEPGATFNGNDLTFSGTVQSYTLDEGYEVKYFIKALDPDNGFANALGDAFILDLPESGPFSVTVTADQLPAGLLIQYGFSVTGRNANPANEAALGSVVIGAQMVSVNDLNTLQAPVSVYPNPTDDMLFIKTDAQVESFEITTLLGQTVLNGNADNRVDVSSLTTGTYFITIHAVEGSKVLKFIKN
ncbi:MAG: T9SS type A sorting domain-containing protein [Phaeodactylibacter sp.]|uniref:T9SS type A sorting domain-containing protein n=1 Tax=Phaeodactylibacter sp. TaxID=1940289 RepID=UPI0032EBA9B9